MKEHYIESPDGLRLHVAEAGRPDAPPILFLHGWSQSWLAWSMQMEDAHLSAHFRLLAADLRGHGQSDAPRGADQYQANAPWAKDVHAIIQALDLRGVMLVGWSYGGSVICDYLRQFGTGAISGINLVAPAVLFTKGAPGRWYGPGLLDNAAGGRSQDMHEAIKAMRGLLHACFARPVAQGYFETQLAASMLVRPDVRGAMVRKELAYEPLFASLDSPVLLTHGAKDQVVLPAVSRALAEMIPHARLSGYPDTGHCPHAEDPHRFNRELAAFVAKARREG